MKKMLMLLTLILAPCILSAAPKSVPTFFSQEGTCPPLTTVAEITQALEAQVTYGHKIAHAIKQVTASDEDRTELWNKYVRAALTLPNGHDAYSMFFNYVLHKFKWDMCGEAIFKAGFTVALVAALQCQLIYECTLSNTALCSLLAGIIASLLTTGILAIYFHHERKKIVKECTPSIEEMIKSLQIISKQHGTQLSSKIQHEVKNIMIKLHQSSDFQEKASLLFGVQALTEAKEEGLTPSTSR